MAFDVAALDAARARAADAMATAETELNAADGQLGDGDTGQTMRRIAQAAAAASLDPSDLGASFRSLGMAAAQATGSSLGTLIAVGLLEVGKSLKGQATAEIGGIADAFEAAELAMLKRGGASLGDKTALDVLHAARSALRSDGDVLAAAKACLAEFRDQQCRIGRARMYPERSIGRDDPGMLAILRLIEGLTD